MRQAAFLFLLMFAISCAQDTDTSTSTDASNTYDDIAVSWELVSNLVSEETSVSRAAFTLKNNSNASLGNDWAIYFNQSPRSIREGSVSDGVAVTQIVGDFYKLSPKEDFELTAGESKTFSYEMNGPMIKAADGPIGLYWVDAKNETLAVSDYTMLPFNRPEQTSRFKTDKVPMYSPQWQYEQNEKMDLLGDAELSLIIPTPKKVKKSNKSVVIDGGSLINYAPELAKEGLFLASTIGSMLNNTMSATSPESVGIITLQLDESLEEAESYTLDISKEKGIVIKSSDAAGAFYGVQSLIALLPINSFEGKQEGLSVPEISIKDAPRFAYRGMHLDVGRNFIPKPAVLKLIDAMAFYKLNVLHLHLTEDEGWRLEIEELPELTQVGAKRGFTLDSNDFLPSAYGSGADPNDASSHGNGYYNRIDYKEIIKYAHDRHIEVIPEINVPGHARAAIKAMEARTRKLRAAGDSNAEQYRLADPDDASEYLSVQSYPDNVVCVCRESVYSFYEKVADDIIEMHQEAEVPLNAIHTGGDEVPRGVWEKSPICEKLIAENASLKSTKDLGTYFLTRINKILNDRNLITAGWEEIAMKKLDEGYIPHPDFKDKNLQPYVWQNTGNLRDLGYRLANAGYPVVLCNVTNFYFDLAYSKDAYEPGLYWGGFIDTRKAYECMPFDVLASVKTDPLGNPLDNSESLETLTANGKKNILGIQGELWSETIKGGDMLEYYYLPKMLGLAERAWAKQASEAEIDANWNTFANTIAQRDMPRLNYRFGGYNYRIPTPGAKLENGTLYANLNLPGFELRYTTDGSTPTETSALYEAPIQIYEAPVEGSEQVQVAAFDARGRSSKTVILE